MKYLEELEKFNKKINRIEKLILLSRFFKSKKIMLTLLEEQASAAKLLMISILKFKHAKNEINITKNPQENIKILKEKIAKELEIENEIESLLRLLEIDKKHKDSPIEFMKKGNIIILDEHQNIQKISLKELNTFQKEIKSIANIFQLQIKG